MHKIYVYRNCSTCRKALKWLDDHAIEYEEVAIRETPPTPEELNTAVKSFSGDLRRLFNTSGVDYREQKLKDRLSNISEEEAVSILAGNGNLVKRPFLISQGKVLTGFKPEVWTNALT